MQVQASFLTRASRPVVGSVGGSTRLLLSALTMVGFALSTVILAGCGNDTAVGDETTDTSSAADAVTGDVAAEDGSGQTTTVVSVSIEGSTEGPRVELDGLVNPDDTITVRLFIRDFKDLYAIASHLTWDEKKLTLVKSEAHILLASNGYKTQSLARLSGKDVLLLGAARFRDGGSPWAPIDGVKVGKQLWATLQFKLLGDTAKLSFKPDHSVARSSKYTDVKTGWQRMLFARTTSKSGGGK